MFSLQVAQQVLVESGPRPDGKDAGFGTRTVLHATTIARGKDPGAVGLVGCVDPDRAVRGVGGETGLGEPRGDAGVCAPENVVDGHERL